MVKKSDMNWNFKLKDARKTRAKHNKTIQRLDKFDVKYNEVIDRFADDMILGKILRSTYWKYHYSGKPKKLSKTLVKEIKSMVNYRTREHIVSGLKSNNYPKSWDTAFYMAHKTKIDAMMKRIAKKAVSYAVKGY